MARRRFLAQLAAWPLAAILPGLAYESKQASRLKIMMKSAWGSDDPTKAAFPFSHTHALAEAGHDVQIFLFGRGGRAHAPRRGGGGNAGGLTAFGGVAREGD